MERFYYSIGLVLTFGLLALFTQIYFWRRKISRMADEDLKRLDPPEWKRHIRFSSYTKFVSRLAWAVVFLFFAISRLANAETGNFLLPIALTCGLSVSFFILAIIGFRADRIAIAELN